MPRVLSKTDITDFRDRLCDAAETVFAEQGLEAVTMRHLANELRVSPMTPYRYFDDKEAILAAVRARAFDRHADALERSFEDSAGDLGQRARATARAYIQFALDNPHAYKLMFDIRQANGEDYPDFLRAAERSQRTMTRHLLEMKRAGIFNGDVDLAGHMYWAALHGPIMLHMSGMLPPQFDAMRLAEALVAALDKSMPFSTGKT